MPKPKSASRNTAALDNAADERIVECEELATRLTLDRTTLWRMVREGRFPKPIQLTASRIGWRWSAVLAWLADREANPVEARTYYKPPRGKKKPVDAPAAAHV
jgi:prophage regulatory protein